MYHAPRPHITTEESKFSSLYCLGHAFPSNQAISEALLQTPPCSHSIFPLNYCGLLATAQFLWENSLCCITEWKTDQVKGERKGRKIIFRLFQHTTTPFGKVTESKPLTAEVRGKESIFQWRDLLKPVFSLTAAVHKIDISCKLPLIKSLDLLREFKEGHFIYSAFTTVVYRIFFHTSASAARYLSGQCFTSLAGTCSELLVSLPNNSSKIKNKITEGRVQKVVGSWPLTLNGRLTSKFDVQWSWRQAERRAETVNSGHVSSSGTPEDSPGMAATLWSLPSEHYLHTERNKWGAGAGRSQSHYSFFLNGSFDLEIKHIFSWGQMK